MVCSAAKIEERAGQVNHNLLEYVIRNFITCIISPYKRNLLFSKRRNAVTKQVPLGLPKLKWFESLRNLLRQSRN